jgi:hypothetical protein
MMLSSRASRFDVLLSSRASRLDLIDLKLLKLEEEQWSPSRRARREGMKLRAQKLLTQPASLMFEASETSTSRGKQKQAETNKSKQKQAKASIGKHRYA